jgi:hypothetical protein
MASLLYRCASAFLGHAEAQYGTVSGEACR